MYQKSGSEEISCLKTELAWLATGRKATPYVIALKSWCILLKNMLKYKLWRNLSSSCHTFRSEQVSPIHLWSRGSSFWKTKVDYLACCLFLAVERTSAQAWLNIVLGTSFQSILPAAIFKYLLKSFWSKWWRWWLGCPEVLLLIGKHWRIQFRAYAFSERDAKDVTALLFCILAS